MSRFGVERGGELPRICPLVNDCEKWNRDLAEYMALREKWSKPDEVAEGVQVYFLEAYRGLTEGMDKKAREEAVAQRQKDVYERINSLCPILRSQLQHVSPRLYVNCPIFSQWYWSQKK